MYRVAVVDDNETWCFVLQTVLEQHQLHVSTFQDGYAFIPVAEQFDLALIDFSMPTPAFKQELDGSEVIYQLKQQFQHPPVLVLLSAFFTEDTFAIAQQICPYADAYLSKSEGLAQIVELVQTRLPPSQDLKTRLDEMKDHTASRTKSLFTHRS